MNFSYPFIRRPVGTALLAVGLLLIGIQRRGVPLARRIAAAIAENEGAKIPVGALDITFYRDRPAKLIVRRPVIRADLLPFQRRQRVDLSRGDSGGGNRIRRQQCAKQEKGKCEDK